jgi:TolB protein
MPKITLLAIVLALAAAPAYADRDIGIVDVHGGNMIPVRVSADSAEMNSLVMRAFDSHGRYRVTGGGYLYDIHFSQAGFNQVRVAVSRNGGGSVASATVSGTSERNALLRAADVAVEKTNGMGLKGFFASKIVFIGQMTGHKEVYTSDLFFGNVRRITGDRAIALSPRWSPDGSRIIYTSFFHSGFPDIFLIDVGSNERTVFESFKGTNSGARFSPDGSQVAMVLSGEGSSQIYVSDPRGMRVSRRTLTDSVKASPCWSPDGGRLVYAASPGPQLYIMSSGGGGSQRVTYGISTYCAEPDWSRAKPEKIAFTARTGGYQICVLDLSSHQSKQVSHAPFDGIEPCWLADGRHLVYTARTPYQSVLSILDTETGRSTRISPVNFGAIQANAWLR